VAALKPEEVQRMFHDLRVHQIELEMQNEELRLAQQAVESSRTRYLDLYDRAPVGYLALNEGARILEANLTAAALLGVVRDELVGQELTRFILPDDQDTHYLHRKRLLQTGRPQVCELRMVRKDGIQFWVRMDATVIRQDGEAVCRSTVSDITDRKRAEEALVASKHGLEVSQQQLLHAQQSLEESNRQLRDAERGLILRNRIAQVFLTVPDEEMYSEVLKIILEAMESKLGVFGYIDDQGALVVPSMTHGVWDACDVVGKTIRFPRETWGDSSWPRAIREKRAIHSNVPSRDTPAGHVPICRHISSPFVHQGRVVGLLQVANKDTDYTEEDVAFLASLGDAVAPVLDARLRREELERERERLLSAIEQAGEMIVITDPQGTMLYVNPAFERTTGYGRKEAVGQNLTMLQSSQQKGDNDRALWETISSGRIFQGCMVNRRKDGTLFTEEATISPVTDAAGQIVSYVAVKRDITNDLRLAAELQQAQKMESVGRLAGGVAHDFNNMLGVIIGYVDLALTRVDPIDSLHADLMEVQQAAMRSADITRQLLAFARKQTIRPEVLDLNETVEKMLKMLRRLIGEDIELAWRPKGDLWSVKMDPAQLDQILANLCVNARDAIVGVGKVTIETDNAILDEADCFHNVEAVPGEYVLLTVSDDGCGMDSETKNRLFEPFFTTKEIGQGTGLGLATIYGIVKQNNGFICVHSELGSGTTFKIYIPRDAGAVGQKELDSRSNAPKGQGETVLMVEDEPAILRLGQRMLSRLGYKVLTANTPDEALRVSAEYAGDIDVLISDVVMPDMNGRDLAERLTATYPGLKVLYMSGYSASIIAERGVLETGVNFIQKPFSTRELAFKVRAAVDRVEPKD